HERHRAGRIAALRELLLRRAKLREVDARARAAAEDDALAADPVEDRVHRVVDREDEARRALRLLLEAHVEPDRRVEGRELVDEDRLQLVLERLRIVLAREVAALTAPRADRPDDPADHLLDGALALGARHPAAEVLLRDDVRGRLRPELRELDVLLLERRAVLPGDVGAADLPLDLRERVAPRDREQAADGEAGALVDDGVDELVWVDLNRALLLYGRHCSSLPPTLNSRFGVTPAAAGARTRRASLGTIGRGPDGAEIGTLNRALRLLAARLDALRDQPGAARCDEQDREPAEHEQRHRHRGGVARVEGVGDP